MKESSCLYVFRFGRFELQPGERRLLADGVLVAIERRAFDVLVSLVERAGHLVTKEELFSLVWPKLVVEENNLQVQVSALRKILGKTAIETVPGQGYRFTLKFTREVIDSAPLTAAGSDRPAAVFAGGAGELADELSYPVPARPNIAPSTRTSLDAPGPMPSAPRQLGGGHRLAAFRRWQSLAGSIPMLLITAAGAWLLQITSTTPVPTTTEPATMSIAILPFAAPTDEQLAELLLREITDAFGRNARSVALASPTLVASYKGKQFDARAIGREINVRYVAEGEIRQADNKRVLSARLIDTASGVQEWSERFEVPGDELPARDEAFATRVSVHLWIALVRAERDRAAHQPPTSLTAPDFWLRGMAIDDESSLSGALAARKLYAKALQIDPRLVGAMLSLGITYGTELDLNSQADRHLLLQDLDELSLRAVGTDRADWRAWYLRGYAAQYNSRWDEVLDAAAELQRIEPNHLAGFGLRAMALIGLGRSEEALAQVDQGLTLDPFGSDVKLLLRQKCKALSYLGQYEKAIDACEKAAVLQEMLLPHAMLTAAYAQLGEMDKAAAAKIRLLKLNPGYTIARLRPLSPEVPLNPVWVHQAETYVIPGLRKAGIPEK